MSFPLLELPIDRPRGIAPCDRIESRKFAWDQELSQGLRGLCLREDVTLFTGLVAAWQVLLSRYSGQEDVFVGASILGEIDKSDGLIGPLRNCLALRTDLSGNPTFREILGRVNEVIEGALRHQFPPDESSMPDCRLPRLLTQSHVFQVMFFLRKAASEACRSSDQSSELTLSCSPHSAGNVTVDLSLYVEESLQGLQGSLEYNADLFDETTIDRLLGHFQVLLAAIVADPAQRIGELPLLTDAERHKLLVEWNDTATHGPPDMCLHELFEEQAEKTPEAVAVVFQDQELTYWELNVRANCLAHRLIAAGVGPEALVGLCAERSPEMVVAILGILKAGGAYVPLDPAYPAGRLQFMLEDCLPVVLLTQSSLIPGLPPHAAQVVCLDSSDASDQSAVNPKPRGNADNLAYVIYTSGSTGRPKGVEITHKNVVASTSVRIAYYGRTIRSHILLHSFAFDSSVAVMFHTLCSGGTLCLPTTDQSCDPVCIGQLMRRYQVSHLDCVPSFYQHLLEFSEGMPTDLKCVIVGGEACPASLVARHVQQLPQTSLYNEYGPTECTVWSTVNLCSDDGLGQNVSIGKPIANVRAYVLDRAGQLVPAGVAGELHLGGEQLARGYLGAPELTAQRFVPDPFGMPGGRLYRTRDLVRWRTDGNLEYLGRIDQQVKLRGFRIELGEIEAAIAKHPAVAQAVVVLREDRPGDKRLAAYVVLGRHRSVSRFDLHEYLGTVLPDYMVPSAFVLLEKVPLTSNGKIDRKALPAPDDSSLALKAEFVAPRDALEKQMAGLWAGILGVRKVGVHNKFFLLGGNSLLAAELISKVRSDLHINLTLRDLCDAPTIAEILTLVKQRRNEPIISDPDGFIETFRAGTDTAIPIICVGDSRPIPLMQAEVPAEVPVIRLGFDGIHTWPPAYLSFDETAELYVQALERHFPRHEAVLVGFSYGGLLAHRLATELLKRGWTLAGVLLIEPDVPYHHLHFGGRLRERLIDVKNRIVSARRRFLAPAIAERSKSPESNESAGTRFRWEHMERHYSHICRTARLDALPGNIVLVGTAGYHRRFGKCWEKLVSDGIDRCVFRDKTDHFDCFREPYCTQWSSILAYWYGKNFEFESSDENFDDDSATALCRT